MDLQDNVEFDKIQKILLELAEDEKIWLKDKFKGITELEETPAYQRLIQFRKVVLDY